MATIANNMKTHYIDNTQSLILYERFSDDVRSYVISTGDSFTNSIEQWNKWFQFEYKLTFGEIAEGYQGQFILGPEERVNWFLLSL